MSFTPFTGFTPLSSEIECNDKFVGLNNQIKIRTGCGWKGIVKDTIREDYCSDKHSWKRLAGREGIKYLCPNCKEVLIDEILKIS